MTKYCPRCGTPNPDDALFCAKCGYQFPQSTTTPSPTPTQPAPQSPPPQPMPPTTQQPTPYYPPPPYPQGPSSLDKFANYNRKYFSLIAGIFTGLEILLFAIFFMLLFISPFTFPGGAGPFSGLFGTLVGASAIYLIIGIFVLIIGIKRSFSGSFSFILGILAFLYFLLIAVALFIIPHTSFVSEGVELVIGGVFLLIAVIMGRSKPQTSTVYYQPTPYTPYPVQTSTLPVSKIIAYVFGIVAAVLTYIGLGGVTSISSSTGVPIALTGIFYFGTSLGIVAGIIAPIGLMIGLFMSKSKIGKSITDIILAVALLIFGVGQIIVGGNIISYGLPNTSGLPGIIAGAVDTLYAGGVLDLIAGIFVLLVSIFLMVEDAMAITKAARTTYYPYPPPPSPPTGGMPPSP
ncbi:zinc ribbon domain-containing protein [Sulfolobaceae archaeon RB850M]